MITDGATVTTALLIRATLYLPEHFHKLRSPDDHHFLVYQLDRGLVTLAGDLASISKETMQVLLLLLQVLHRKTTPWLVLSELICL